MHLAKSIVDCGIECGGGHERAEFGNGIGQTQTFRHLSSGFVIQRREIPIDFERMPKFLVAAGHFRKFDCQRLHRVVLGLVRQCVRWKRESVIEGIAPNPLATFPPAVRTEHLTVTIVARLTVAPAKPTGARKMCSS